MAARLPGYRSWGGRRVDPGVRQAFAAAVEDLVALQCTLSGNHLLPATVESMAHAPVRPDDVFDLEGGASDSTEIQAIQEQRLRSPVHSYVSGPALQGRPQRAFTDTAIAIVTRRNGWDVESGSHPVLAMASDRDVLIDTPELRYDWRTPKKVLAIRILERNRVAVLDEDLGAIRVLDFSSPHPYAARELRNGEKLQHEGVTRGGMRLRLEEFGEADSAGAIYSEEAGRIYRRPGAGCKFALGFVTLETGDVWVHAHGFNLVITLHSLGAARKAAEDALSDGCLGASGKACRAPPCWPAELDG